MESFNDASNHGNPILIISTFLILPMHWTFPGYMLAIDMMLAKTPAAVTLAPAP